MFDARASYVVDRVGGRFVSDYVVGFVGVLLVDGMHFRIIIASPSGHPADLLVDEGVDDDDDDEDADDLDEADDDEDDDGDDDDDDDMST